MVKYKSHRQPRFFKRPLGIVGIVLLAGILGLTTLELTGKTHLIRERKAVSGIIPSTPSTDTSTPSKDKEDDTTEPSETPPATPPESPKEGDTPSSQPTGAPPRIPTGNFVSNHSPSLSTSPAIESVCNTSPNAKCHIEFTNEDGVIKKLEAQTTDSNGSTIWTWNVAQAGFTKGTWKIKVVAMLNGQTKSAEGAIPFEVKP